MHNNKNNHISTTVQRQKNQKEGDEFLLLQKTSCQTREDPVNAHHTALCLLCTAGAAPVPQLSRLSCTLRRMWSIRVKLKCMQVMLRAHPYVLSAN